MPILKLCFPRGEQEVQKWLCLRQSGRSRTVAVAFHCWRLRLHTCSCFHFVQEKIVANFYCRYLTKILSCLYIHIRVCVCVCASFVHRFGVPTQIPVIPQCPHVVMSLLGTSSHPTLSSWKAPWSEGKKEVEFKYILFVIGKEINAIKTHKQQISFSLLIFRPIIM